MPDGGPVPVLCYLNPEPIAGKPGADCVGKVIGQAKYSVFRTGTCSASKR